MSTNNPAAGRDFTPAVPLLWAYDWLVAAFTRESLWRAALLEQLAPRNSDVIADLGCGTASFLALLGRAEPAATLIGVDPDARILPRARRKLESAGVGADLRQGYLRDAASALAGSHTSKIVSSLVFHQVPLVEKRAGLAAMYAALGAGGELHVADYGWQRTPLMRSLFRIVQRIDGYEDTQPNADGMLPGLMRAAGFEEVRETRVFSTPSGSISLYRAVRRRA